MTAIEPRFIVTRALGLSNGFIQRKPWRVIDRQTGKVVATYEWQDDAQIFCTQAQKSVDTQTALAYT